MADDLAAVAEILVAESKFERIGLGLGHSFGGTLTLTAAGRRPGLFARAVLVDPVIFPPMDKLERLTRAVQSGMGERARSRRHIWPSRADARASFATKDLFADWRDDALDLYVSEGLRDRDDGQVELKCSGGVEGAIFESGHTLDIYAEARAVDAPALLLSAVGGSFSIADYEAIAKLTARGSVDTIDGGHLVVMEDPDLVVEAVAKFVSETPDDA
jgi:pimeloyl-ACP methyl ester carboxylesterase